MNGDKALKRVGDRGEGGISGTRERDRPEIPHLFDRVTLVMMKVNKVEKGKMKRQKGRRRRKKSLTDAAVYSSPSGIVLSHQQRRVYLAHVI